MCYSKGIFGGLMMKIDRLLGIIMMIMNKGRVTSTQLSEYFQVSVRTIQRDLDTLSAAGIPIYAEVGKKGGYQLLDQYKLDRNFLNTKEAKILISLLESFENAIPYSEVKSVFNKFSVMMEDDTEESKIVVKLNPWVNQKEFKHNLDVLTKARDDHYKIQMKYIDSNLQESHRIICPYTLVMMGTTWYVYAYCQLREDFRMFKLNRILSCELLYEIFEMKKPPTALPWENSMDSGRENTKIILQVDRVLQGRLSDYIDYKNCKIDGDKMIINLYYPVDEWLYSFLFGFVPHVKIVEPEWLREEFIKRLRLSIERNIL